MQNILNENKTLFCHTLREDRPFYTMYSDVTHTFTALALNKLLFSETTRKSITIHWMLLKHGPRETNGHDANSLQQNFLARIFLNLVYKIPYYRSLYNASYKSHKIFKRERLLALNSRKTGIRM